MQLPPLRPVYPPHITPLSAKASQSSTPQMHTANNQTPAFTERRKSRSRREANDDRGQFELRHGRGRRRSDRFDQPFIFTQA